jgi:hypothetical protein
MSIPDFERAEYTQPQPPAAYADVLPPSPYTAAAPALPVVEAPVFERADHFAKSVVFGTGAAVAGALGYGLIGLSGWMVSIVAIGVGWLVARAMMTGSLGVGGRKFQVAAVLLTYFACGAGHVMDIFWFSRADLAHHSFVYLFLYAAMAILIGPFAELSHPFNGALGLLILFVGLRTAWRLAAGSPGFGNTAADAASGQGLTPFG